MGIPKLNKVYNYFDDGKIRESRRMSVTITDIIPFDKADKEILTQWQKEVEECDWLYSKETDYFVEGILEISKEGRERVVFVRTLNNGWFSVGWWGGRLDLDESLLTFLNN